MEIILSAMCRSLTGTLGKRFGYSICRRGSRFVSQRNSKGFVPKDGHLRFIFACARMAQNHWLAEDIRVRGEELLAAAAEAGVTLETIQPEREYNAQEVMKVEGIKCMA